MHAHRLNVTIKEDHRLSVDLPRDFPSGPAEVIVLTEAPRARKVVRLEGVLSSSASGSEPDGDPIAEALADLREERAELLDQRAGRYRLEDVDEP